MREYEVTITETLEMTVAVEAESREEAQQIASDNWKNGDYKLSRMVDEMTAMRKEVDRLHDRSIQARCTFLMNEAENKVHQVSSLVLPLPDAWCRLFTRKVARRCVMQCRLCGFPQFSPEWSMASPMPAKQWRSVPDGWM